MAIKEFDRFRAYVCPPVRFAQVLWNFYAFG